MTPKLIAIFAISLAFLCACSKQRKYPLVIVLGIDGMDPNFTERHLSQLPNLQQLIKIGEFQRLQTTMPPQSPVAWSTFSTGLDPAEHGLLDFVYRDPKTGEEFSSMGETIAPTHSISFGRYTFPLSSPQVRKFRKGEVFWKALAESGIPTKILRMPVNYPPENTKAIALSGMGVPDIRGTFGTFSFFTDSSSETRREIAGGEIIPVTLQKDHAELSITGPANPYLRAKTPMTAKVSVDVDPFESVARFKVDGDAYILKAGEWSPWIPIKFAHANGMIRVYAKAFRPDFEVYVSPVNFDPLKPDAQIAQPLSECKKIAEHIGRFYTQGIPEDTEVYRDHIFTRAEYLSQSKLVADEEIKILKYELSDFPQGFLFFHFSTLDQNSHMLWGKFDEELLETYKLVDDTVGWVMKTYPQATLVVMSDHGFSSFDHAVNINAWLKEQGFDRSAIAYGLNSIHVNNADVAKKIEQRLPTLPFITRVVSIGDTLIVGFKPGYRYSWDGGPLVTDNTDAWIGDHCIDPQFVPGLLISNRKIMFGPSLKIDKNLWERITKVSETAGYSSPQEFVHHVLDRELKKLENAESKETLIAKMKGLGYLE